MGYSLADPGDLADPVVDFDWGGSSGGQVSKLFTKSITTCYVITLFIEYFCLLKQLVGRIMKK